MLEAQFCRPLLFKSKGDQFMKKLTLLKLSLVVAMAVCIYGWATPSEAATCPPICSHLICGDGEHAFCNSKGQCVCP